MKKLRNIFFINSILLLFPIFALAQNNENCSLTNAFKAADANEIAKHFNDNIELSIPKADNFFTKQQARSILADFFRRNTVKDFIIVHKGTKENSTFTIGTLITTTGNFRVSYFSRKTNSLNFIYQLRIENPNE